MTMPSNTIEQLVAADGKTQIIANWGACFSFVIKEPAQAEMEVFIASMESGVIDAFWSKALLEPSPYGASLPYALKCSQAGHVAIQIKNIVERAGIAGLPKRAKAKDLVGMLGYEETTRILMALKPPTVLKANELLTQAGRARLNAFSLNEMLKRVGSFAAFVDAISDLSFSSNQEKRFAFSALVAMRSKNWILLPTNAATKIGHILKGMALRGNKWSDSPLSFLSTAQISLLEELTGEPTGKEYLDFTARVKARHVVFCTTLSALHQMTWPMADRILFSSGKTARTGANTLANPWIRLRWKAVCRANGPLAMVEIDKVDHLSNLRQRAPEDPRLEEWLQLLAKDCDSYTGGELHPIYNDYITWLKWLNTLDQIPNPFEVVRLHIRDDRDPQANTFRRNLAEKNYQITKSQNSPLIRMDKLFQRLGARAEETGTVFSNPIRLVDDKFKAQRGERPDHTTKSRIEPYVIEELQDLIVIKGMDGQFKWSDDIQRLARTKVLQGNKPTDIFCPIFPAILYLMMVYPLRARQVLWLDSGEMDELVFDFVNRQFIANSTGRPVKGRTLGVFQPPTDSSNVQEFQLDFQVAINKTPLVQRRRSAFTIHYVPEVVIWLVQEVLRWQQEYGTAAHMVKECEAPTAGSTKNAALQQFFPEICPLFRYPGSSDFYPPSHAQLAHFWGRFGGFYDRKNTAIDTTKSSQPRRRPKLSRQYTRHDSSWDVANFSVHCLRVAGVSALLDAGLPIGVVASMTGHASLVMTIYYYRAERDQIRHLISEAKVKLQDMPKLDQIIRHLDECESIDKLLIGTPQAMKRLDESRKTRIWQLSLSGICPGATCDEGLPEEFWQAHGRDVPGSKCALCRFRVYGPPFLAGLVYECNCLMFELEQLANRQVKLRAIARKAEADGNDVDAATARAEDDMLVQESQLQVKVLARLTEMIFDSAKKLDHGLPDAQSVGTLITQDGVLLQPQMEAAGQFAQIKKILEDAEVFVTSRQIVPEQALRIMQEKFMQMCRANGANVFLAGLPADIAKKSTLMFARLLEKTIPQRDLRESLFQGQTAFSQLPGAGKQLLAGIQMLDTIVRTEEAQQLNPPPQQRQIEAK